MTISDSTSDKAHALRAIQGLENGRLNSSDAYTILKDLDPILVYFVLRYLREKLAPSHPDASALQSRLIELTGTYAELQKMFKLGEKDIMRQWFDDSHSVREFSQDASGYVELIVDKLEG